MKSFSWKNNVTLRINQKNFESFANECMKEDIILSDVQKDGSTFLCTMSFDSFRKIRPLARKTKVRIRIVKKAGAFYFVRIHRKRYGFYAGAIIALCLFVYLTSCIWVVDVTGNDTTTTEEILEVMERNGIYVGSVRYGKKISRIKNRALIELDSLSWLWVTLDGTRAVVDVREKGDSTDIVDKSKPCNLVAAYPGVIDDMQVKSGRKVVVRGDTVKKGDLLVSGITETAYRQNRYIFSSGTVTARTWRTLEGEFANTERIERKTGKSHKKITLTVLGKDIKLYLSNKVKFKDYVKKTHSGNVKIFKNIYLPITFTTDEFCEIIIENKNLSDEEVVSRAVQSLTDEIKSQRDKDAITVKRTYGYDTLPGGNVHVTVTLESLENIAFPVEIEVQNAEDNTLGESN